VAAPATLIDLIRRPHTIIGLMLTLPYALVLNSADVAVSTRFWEDGTVRRQVRASASSYHRTALAKWTADVEAGAPWQHHWREIGKSDASVRFTRNFIVSRLPAGQTRRLIVTDVFDDPLNVYSTYEFTETVSIRPLRDVDPAMAAAGGRMLSYSVQMPGSIVDAVVNPMSGRGAPDIEGGIVRFALDPSVPEHQVTVVSKKVRWTYLIIILYVLGFVLYQGGRFIRRNLSSKPKRI